MGSKEYDMSDKGIMIHLPEHLMERYTNIAARQQLSVEEAVLGQLENPDAIEVPSLSQLPDRVLWDIVNTRMKDEQYERLEELNEQEEAEVEYLSQIVDSQMLERSVALAVLNQRGYETSHFFKMT